MADDIVERLRDYGLTLEETVVICDRRAVDEAANRIELYRREVSQLQRYVGEKSNQYAECLKENSSLRAQLEEAHRNEKKQREAYAAILRAQAERPRGIKPGKRAADLRKKGETG